MSGNNIEIGEAIKTVREEKGFSLEEVAARTTTSVEYLEKIESGKVFPSLGLIVRFSELFEVSVGEIFRDDADSPFCIVRRDAGAAISRFASNDGKTTGYRYKGLGQQKKNRQMEPFLVTLLPNEAHKVEPNEHIGEEFIFVLEGRVKVTLLGHTDTLNPGDSIYYDSTLPHTVACDGEEAATILAVIYAKDEMIII